MFFTRSFVGKGCVITRPNPFFGTWFELQFCMMLDKRCRSGGLLPSHFGRSGKRKCVCLCVELACLPLHWVICTHGPFVCAVPESNASNACGWAASSMIARGMELIGNLLTNCMSHSLCPQLT